MAKAFPVRSARAWLFQALRALQVGAVDHADVMIRRAIGEAHREGDHKLAGRALRALVRARSARAAIIALAGGSS